MSNDQAGSEGAERGLEGAAEAVAQFDEPAPSVLWRLQAFLHSFPTAIPIAVTLFSVMVFAMISNNFFSPFNLSIILQQVTVIGVLAMAQTLIILTAGIDLSVGAIMVLSSIVMGRLAVVYGFPPEISFVLGLLTGALCGFVNGVLVAKLRLPPFIVTLGTWNIFAALVTLISRSETIRQPDIAATGPLLQWLGTKIKFSSETLPFFLDWMHGAVITFGSILMILIAVVLLYVLSQTAFGRHIYATGDDPEAARLAGINTDWTLIKVYTLAGFICGIAGWVLIGRIGAASPLAGQEANLEAITAVVIGGTSLFGGRGSIIGTLFGALIVGVFQSGLSLVGVDPLWRLFTVGVLIIAAVALDQWIRRISS